MLRDSAGYAKRMINLHMRYNIEDGGEDRHISQLTELQVEQQSSPQPQAHHLMGNFCSSCRASALTHTTASLSDYHILDRLSDGKRRHQKPKSSRTKDSKRAKRKGSQSAADEDYLLLRKLRKNSEKSSPPAHTHRRQGRHARKSQHQKTRPAPPEKRENAPRPPPAAEDEYRASAKKEEVPAPVSALPKAGGVRQRISVDSKPSVSFADEDEVYEY